MPPIDFNGLDTTVHGPVRLGVLSALQVEGPLDFTSLKKRLEVADGALGQHITKLEDVGYLEHDRQFIGRRPRTTYRLTPKGRAALRDYLAEMQTLIEVVAGKRLDEGTT